MFPEPFECCEINPDPTLGFYDANKNFIFRFSLIENVSPKVAQTQLVAGLRG